MQGRHRSPVDGLRSQGVGRLPKDVHGGGGGGYGGSGYRNFGRGGKYRRAPPPKPNHSYLPPPPPPPPRKIDIMMEAGRLAAEYLVSKGEIPASLLPTKWPSDTVSQDSKGRDRDGSSSHGRASALDRLGGSNNDSGYGRKRYSDERDLAGPGQQTRGKRKRETNSSRNHGSDWGRDDRNGGWADNRSRYPNENGVEDDDDVAAPGYKPSGGYDYYGSSRTHKPAGADSEPRSEESGMDNYDGGDDTGSKASSSNTRKDPLPDTDAEPMARTNEGDTLNMEVDNARSNENPEQASKDRTDEDSPEQLFMDEDDPSTHAAADLLKLCSSTKIPTKPRSAVTNRSPKVDQSRASAVPETTVESSISPEKDEIPSAWTTSDTELSTGLTGGTNAAPAQDDSMPAETDASQLCCGEPTSVPTTNTADSRPEDSAALPLYFTKENANRNAVHTTENRSCTRSLSFPEKFSAPLQEDSKPALVLSSSNRICSRSMSFPETSSIAVLLDAVDKSPVNPEVSAVDGFALQSGQTGGTKRPREWYSDQKTSSIAVLPEAVDNSPGNPEVSASDGFALQSGQTVALGTKRPREWYSDQKTSSIAVLLVAVDKIPGNAEVTIGDGFALQSGQVGATKRPREWYCDQKISPFAVLSEAVDKSPGNPEVSSGDGFALQSGQTGGTKRLGEWYSNQKTSSIVVLPEAVDKSPGSPEVSASGGFGLQSDQTGGTKGPREWYSDVVSPNEFGLMRMLRSKQMGSQDNGLFSDQSTGTEQKKPTTALFHNGEPLCQVKLEEEQRSNSFKICDLNLMHAPEITEVADDHTNDTGNSSADFGLSISNDPKIADMYPQHSNNDKGITIIDLEDDSPVQDEVWDPSKHKGETMYPNLDNFLHPTESTDDLLDIQAISDLLGSDPSVPADMNNLHPGMTIPGAEGIPADDDSIYVALGEIPISFMDVWGPPTQEYGKFF